MQTTTVYLTDELKEKINSLSLSTGIPKAKIIREALQNGLKNFTSKKSNAWILLELAKLKGRGPRDLAKKHNQYGWDE